MQRIFHTPEGVRDIYNGECSQKHHLQTEIRKVFDSYGYEEIETPSFEYFEVFSREVGTIPSKDLYKFFDREGNTLVLRPDFTPSVSRACATYFNPEHQVITLSYTGNTFINNSSYQGRLKETTQMGVERIGDDSAEADAELLAMTVECLLKAGLKEFQVSVLHRRHAVAADRRARSGFRGWRKWHADHVQDHHSADDAVYHRMLVPMCHQRLQAVRSEPCIDQRRSVEHVWRPADEPHPHILWPRRLGRRWTGQGSAVLRACRDCCADSE